ncbi:MAG: hypothetical protein JRI72_00465 [Deltaproteobacteria bacterium]|nr:hypothetical protein [Deltaproteobacteria bacterium]
MALTSPKGISADQVIEAVAVRGMSLSEASRHLGIAKSTLSKRLQHLNIQPNGLKKYKEHRADLLAYYQLQLLSALTPADIKKMSPVQRITCFGILYDKERLERGQSTENIAYADLVKAEEMVRRRMEKFEEKYGIEPQDVLDDQGNSALETGPKPQDIGCSLPG